MSPGNDQGEGLTVDFDPEHDSATEAVVEALSRALGVQPIELEPIAASIDPDALEALVGPRLDGTRREDVTVVFRYDDREVTVAATGRVTVRTAS